VAMATPGRMVSPLLRDDMASVPASPEKKATRRSMSLGFVRARISGVASFSGESQVANTAMRMTSVVLIARFQLAFLPSGPSAVVSAMPQVRMGPIMGEMSMPPMMIAGLLSSRPSRAMRQEKISIAK
jgi:hypothetical protein